MHREIQNRQLTVLNFLIIPLIETEELKQRTVSLSVFKMILGPVTKKFHNVVKYPNLQLCLKELGKKSSPKVQALRYGTELMLPRKTNASP